MFSIRFQQKSSPFSVSLFNNEITLNYPVTGAHRIANGKRYSWSINRIAERKRKTNKEQQKRELKKWNRITADLGYSFSDVDFCYLYRNKLCARLFVYVCVCVVHTHIVWNDIMDKRHRWQTQQKRMHIDRMYRAQRDTEKGKCNDFGENSEASEWKGSVKLRSLAAGNKILRDKQRQSGRWPQMRNECLQRKMKSNSLCHHLHVCVCVCVCVCEVCSIIPATFPCHFFLCPSLLHFHSVFLHYCYFILK